MAISEEKEREKKIKMGNIPVTVECNGSVGQYPKHETNGRPSVTIDTQKAAFLRILPPSAGYNHQVSRPSWMHRLQFHRLKSERTVFRVTHIRFDRNKCFLFHIFQQTRSGEETREGEISDNTRAPKQEGI